MNLRPHLQEIFYFCSCRLKRWCPSPTPPIYIDEWCRSRTLVKHVSSQPQCSSADVTSETLSMEEVAFCAQSLHHIHTLLTEVARVAATHPGSKLLSQVNLKHQHTQSSERGGGGAGQVVRCVSGVTDEAERFYQFSLKDCCNYNTICFKERVRDLFMTCQRIILRNGPIFLQ